MANERTNAYRIYQLYASAKSHFTSSFMRIGKLETFQKRKDVKSFSRLIVHFRKNQIDTLDKIELFMKLNAKRLQDEFYVQNLMTLESLDCYNEGEKKYGSEKKYLHFVFSSFKFINNYCEENSITLKHYFKNGRIPQSLRHYRENKIAEDIIVYSKTLQSTKYKNDVMLMVFAKRFFQQYEIILKRIEQNPQLESILIKGFNYLLKNQKKRNILLKKGH